MIMSTPSLADLLSTHEAHLQLRPTDNKIVCQLTNHEMPAKADAVAAYVNGKRFRKALEWYSNDFSRFLPHIIQHKENEKLLYCIVTKRDLNKVPDQINAHVKGKKFLRLKEEYEIEQKRKADKAALKKAKQDKYDAEYIWVPDEHIIEDHTKSPGRRNNTDASNDDEDMMGSDHEDKDLIGSDHEDNFDHTTMYIEEESNNDDGMEIIRKAKPSSKHERRNSKSKSKSKADISSSMTSNSDSNKVKKTIGSKVTKATPSSEKTEKTEKTDKKTKKHPTKEKKAPSSKKAKTK